MEVFLLLCQLIISGDAPLYTGIITETKGFFTFGKFINILYFLVILRMNG